MKGLCLRSFFLLSAVALVSANQCNVTNRNQCTTKKGGNRWKCKWLTDGPFKNTCLRKIQKDLVPKECSRHWTVAMDGLPDSEDYSCEKCAREFVLKRLDGSNRGRCVKRPNIVVILADDVGTGDIPFFWRGENTSVVEMPNLERLATRGVLFEDAHSTPLCAPSRYMLLSGNYPHRGHGAYGTWNMLNDRNQFLDNQKSIALVLKNYGYRTGVFGKWHLGAKIPPQGIKSKTNLITDPRHHWSKPLIRGPPSIGFTESVISIGGIQNHPYNFFRNGRLDFDRKDAVWWAGGSYNASYGTSKIPGDKEGEGDPDWDASAYDMILVNETKDFIERHLEENEDKPFFAYIGFGAVHTPHAPPIEYIDGSKVEGRYMTEHLDMLGLMDKAVGSLMDVIEEKNLEEDTIVIFTSDNGGLVINETETGHRASGLLRGAKSLIYDGGHRVPLLISQPGAFPQGERRDQVVGLNDLYATILELVQIKKPAPPSARDSISFADYIKSGNSSDVQRESLGTFSLKGKYAWNHALRKGKWKFVHHPHNSTMELYDMEEDIGEVHNKLHDQPTQEIQDMAAQMCKELRVIGPCPLKGTKYKARCVKDGFSYNKANYCNVKSYVSQLGTHRQREHAPPQNVLN